MTYDLVFQGLGIYPTKTLVTQKLFNHNDVHRNIVGNNKLYKLEIIHMASNTGMLRQIIVSPHHEKFYQHCQEHKSLYNDKEKGT